MKHVLGALLGAATLLGAVPSIAQTTLTIATVNNGDMIRMQALTIGAAVGRAKVAAIRAALKGRLLNGLITDEATAGAILKP